MKLSMSALMAALIRLCILVSLVDSHSVQQGSPRPLLMEDPAGYYSLRFDVAIPFGYSFNREQQFHRRFTARRYITSGSNHSLAKILSRNQREYVCRGERICLTDIYRDLAQGRGTEISNYLPSDGLFCTDREWFSPEDNQLVIYTLQFLLVPGVCFTRYQQFSFCDNPKITFPSDSECVTFFKGEACSGGALGNIYSDDLDMLETAILGSKSFAFC